MVDIKWEELGFSYIKTPYRFIAHWQGMKEFYRRTMYYIFTKVLPRFTMANSVLKVLKLIAEKMAISIFFARRKIANG